ncbi:hypothetical protein Tco_0190588 [Tanacetum coccineum]
MILQLRQKKLHSEQTIKSTLMWLGLCLENVTCFFKGQFEKLSTPKHDGPPGNPFSEHVLEMKGIVDQLPYTWETYEMIGLSVGLNGDNYITLGKTYDNDMAVNLVNRSLNKDCGILWHYGDSVSCSAGHVLISADRIIEICLNLIYRRDY